MRWSTQQQALLSWVGLLRRQIDLHELTRLHDYHFPYACTRVFHKIELFRIILRNPTIDSYSRGNNYAKFSEL